MKYFTRQEKIAAIKSSLLPGDELDPKTLHMFREEDGEVVEYKFCACCRAWKPITDYNQSAHNKDGLHSYCKECANHYSAKERNKKKLPDPVAVSLVKEGPTPVVDNPIMRGNKYEEIEALLNSLKEGDVQKDKEIEALREERKSLQDQAKDLTHLTENQIKEVLFQNNIPIRYLFEAIAQKAVDRYDFFAYDKEAGLTIPIKTQETALPISFQYEYGQLG